MPESQDRKPRVFRLLQGDALDVKHTPFGSVGRVFRGEGVEAVWVSKKDEAVDPDWFAQSSVDLIVVVQGELRVDFEERSFPSQVLRIGDLLVLPSNTRCRAYRWPRDRKEPTVFLAVYPVNGTAAESVPSKESVR